MPFSVLFNRTPAPPVASLNMRGGCYRTVHVAINGFILGGSEAVVYGSTGVTDAELDLATRG